MIVLVHRATMDHHTFDAQVPPLVEAGYRVLTLDLRGHGQSTPIGTQSIYPYSRMTSKPFWTR